MACDLPLAGEIGYSLPETAKIIWLSSITVPGLKHKQYSVCLIAGGGSTPPSAVQIMIEISPAGNRKREGMEDESKSNYYDRERQAYFKFGR